MEERMGDNLGDVRIHTGPTAAQACEDINARAFTVGNHVAFNTGEYDPSSAEGQHVLAHELAHVRQQTGGAVSMLPQPGELEIDPDERLEREAEETAQRVMEGGELGIQRLADTEVHVQRMVGSVDTETTWNPGEKSGKVPDGPSVADKVEAKIDEQTTKEYRLTKGQLRSLVSAVSDPGQLGEYLEEQGIEAISSFEDSMSSGVSGASKIAKAGSKVGSLAGPAGRAAGALAGAPLGYILAKKFGKDTASDIQRVIRERLDLNLDQEFDTDSTSDEATVGQSRRDS
jgi:hypothetical protein